MMLRVPTKLMTNQWSASIAVVLFTCLITACGGGAEPRNENTSVATSSRGSSAPPAAQSSTLNGRASVTGFVFQDDNRNGTYDAGEVRLAGQSVVLTNRDRTVEYQMAKTAADGGFRFADLDVGEYRVSIQLPADFERITDDSVVFPLRAGEVEELQFAIVAAGESRPR
jgi:hypothetical protein